MSAEVLRPACELAFAVARDGADAADPIEPPAAMRSFLYVEELPRRAIAAAQQAIEENSDFRHRVAQRADEQEIGRAGYLWLRRPSGWAQEFEDLAVDEPDGDTDDPVGDGPAANGAAAEDLELPVDDVEELYRGLTAEPLELVTAQPPEPDLGPDEIDQTLATVSAIGGADRELGPGPSHDSPSIPSGTLGLAAVTDIENADLEPAEATFDLRDNGAGDGLSDDGEDFEADALESELASLRGLVARLANERESVVSSVPDLDPEDDGVMASHSPGAQPPTVLRTEVEALQHELYLAQADLTIVRQEREEAQRLQSDALKRQVQMEKELANVRETRAELENELTSTQARLISVEERFARIETQLGEADHERQVVKSQLETMTLERNQIRDERSAFRAERDDLRVRLNEINEKTSGMDVGELVESYRNTSSELADTSRELARILAQAEEAQEQVRVLTEETVGLKTERGDLRSRLGEAETSLEAISTQYDALRIDAERMAADLGTLRAERDGLQSQLAELQTSLSDMLADQAESRQRNDNDRRALNELRVERDVMLARLADLEQAEQEARGRIESLIAERDDLLVGRDELLDERGQLRAELGTASNDRSTLQEHLAAAEGQMSTLQTELQRERRQREELANRLLQLDEQTERLTAEQAALTLERDDLITIVERLENERADAEQFRRERDNLASELADARSQHRQEIDEVTRRLDAVADETDELRNARVRGDAELTERNAELQAARAELTNLQADRDRLVADWDQITAELADRRAAAEATQAELEELRTALDDASTRADESDVALQVKESELRTVLGARTVDAAEIEKLRTNLAEAMLRADEQVADKSQQLAEMDQQLAARTEQLAAMDQQVADADRRLAESDQAMAEADQRLADANQQLVDADQRLADANQQLVDADQRLADANQQLADADQRLAEANERVAGADQRLADANQQLADADRRLAESNQQLVDATGELEATNLQLADSNEQLVDATRQLAERGEELADANRQLAERDEQLAARDLQLAERDEAVADRDRQLADRERQLADSNEQLVDATRQLAESGEQLNSKDAELQALRVELEAARDNATESAMAADRLASGHSDDLAAAQARAEEMSGRLRAAEEDAARLREELAVTRVELASTNAELEAHSAAAAAPPVPPSLVAEFDEADESSDDDELDSMAAEVRSALRGPSVLDTIVGEPPVAPEEAEPEPDVDAMSGPVIEVEDVEPTADEQAEPEDDLAAGLEPTARLDIVPERLGAPDEHLVDLGGRDDVEEPADFEAPVEAEVEEIIEIVEEEPALSGGLVEVDDGPIGDGAGRDLLETALPTGGDEEDELDLVSELIAQTVSSFSVDEMADLPGSDEQIDLAAELVQSGEVPFDPTPAPPSILGTPTQARPAEQPDLGARRSGGPKRRGIEIPGDIMDDEVAVARYVVSSPDVVLLVDGDSVAQLGWPKLPVPQQRDALVTYLADLSASTGAAPDVVFDGRIGDDDSLPASRAVRIRLSTPPTPPAAALEELVDAYPQQWPIALVTDDLELAATAADRGAAVLNNGQLLDLFIAE